MNMYHLHSKETMHKAMSQLMGHVEQLEHDQHEIYQELRELYEMLNKMEKTGIQQDLHDILDTIAQSQEALRYKQRNGLSI